MRALARLLSPMLAIAWLALPLQADANPPAAASFDKLKALAGDWIDVDGSMGLKGQVAVSYRVIGGGSSVMETIFPGQKHEMVTVYYRDGNSVALTHYCSAGNQPRMRAQVSDGKSMAFEFDGGSNLDPAKDGHMHAGTIEFLGPDRVRAQWIGWDKGKPSAHAPVFNLERKKA